MVSATQCKANSRPKSTKNCNTRIKCRKLPSLNYNVIVVNKHIYFDSTDFPIDLYYAVCKYEYPCKVSLRPYTGLLLQYCLKHDYNNTKVSPY